MRAPSNARTTTDELSTVGRDGYTSAPTHVRIYREETGDPWPWHIDGADDHGNYTEAVDRFATFAEAVAHAPAFLKDCTDNYGVTWAWVAGRRGIIRPAAVK